MVEAGRGGPLLGLRREGQRGQPGRQVVEDPLAGALLALAPLPDVHDARGRLGRDVAVDVGVAADELAGLAAGDGRQVGAVLLLEELGEEDRLEQEVAELVREPRPAGGDRVGHLEGLLDGVGHDRLGGLDPVPRALAPQPQTHLGERGDLRTDGPGPERLAAGQRVGVRQRAGDEVRLGVRRGDDRPVGDGGEVERGGGGRERGEQAGLERRGEHAPGAGEGVERRGRHGLGGARPEAHDADHAGQPSARRARARAGPRERWSRPPRAARAARRA